MAWATRPRSDFGTLRAICAGSGPGPKLLLLHGVGLRAEAWAAQIDALADGIELVAPDMAGHGESSGLDGPVSLAAYTERVAGALEGQVVVAGHSMGAMIALDLAITHPKLVLGVAALNAIYRRRPEALDAVTARAKGLDGTSPPDPSGPMERWFGGIGSPAADACRDWLSNADPAGYRDAYRTFATEDGPSDQGLRSLVCPSLFFTGGQEPNSTPAMSEAMAALAPAGRAVVLPDAAHMMPMTHPDAVTTVLRDFYSTCVSARAVQSYDTR